MITLTSDITGDSDQKEGRGQTRYSIASIAVPGSTKSQQQRLWLQLLAHSTFTYKNSKHSCHCCPPEDCNQLLDGDSDGAHLTSFGIEFQTEEEAK